MTTTNAPTAGRCPECGGAVPRSRILIEYDVASGETERFAECPACERVVHPA